MPLKNQRPDPVRHSTSTPNPTARPRFLVQRFAPEAFVAWVAKQAQQADVVHCCYEAGPFGFVLHRRLMGLGVKSLVVRPRNWDEYGKKVNTDRRDAPAAIGGWGAMWRPLEIYLYDWWPVRDERRVFERLSRMSVRVEGSAG